MQDFAFGAGETIAANSAIFWSEMPSCEHLVQFYDHEHALIDSLEGFVAGGLLTGESVVVIATREHREALDARLKARGLDVAYVQARDRYVALDAEATLSAFMVDGWPDEVRFSSLIRQLLGRARASGHRVRAYGEMVALLLERGEQAAMLRLEQLWHSVVQRESLPLLCAYPMRGFTGPAAVESVRAVCRAHTRLVA
ncbi:MAG TPA: MEDS domain-containing protein [Nevskiaceae bacterium]|nr:MEDS domain-containing protein [Nevskiaceae bacterium]